MKASTSLLYYSISSKCNNQFCYKLKNSNYTKKNSTYLDLSLQLKTAIKSLYKKITFQTYRREQKSNSSQVESHFKFRFNNQMQILRAIDELKSKTFLILY